jgi:uncharacterized protein
MEMREMKIEVAGASLDAQGAPRSKVEVSAIEMRPGGAKAMLVLGHGAGAGMRHAWMEAMARELAEAGVATLRYQFPYMEKLSRGKPDRPAVATATVKAAVEKAAEISDGLPIFAGGKSFGGRMTSTAAAEGLIPGVKGLVFFGFPLHPPGQPGTKRAEHLGRVTVPMLFLQGTRDALADLKLLRPICKGLGERATLHVVETADHSFHVLKSAGRSDADVLRELAQTAAAWMAKHEGRNLIHR